MKIKCLTDLSEITTKGKEYEVKEEGRDFYTIIADDGNVAEVAKCFIGKFFEVIE